MGRRKCRVCRTRYDVGVVGCCSEKCREARISYLRKTREERKVVFARAQEEWLKMKNCTCEICLAYRNHIRQILPPAILNKRLGRVSFEEAKDKVLMRRSIIDGKEIVLRRSEK